MADKKEEKNEDIWSVGLAIINENQPPEKVLVNKETEEQIDITQAIARILNYQEDLMSLVGKG